MWKVKYIGGPRSGEEESKPISDRRLLIRDMHREGPAFNGAYVRVEVDEDVRVAVMRWEGSDGA